MHKTWYLDPTRVQQVWTSPRQDLDSQGYRDVWITFRLMSKLNAHLTQGPVTLSTPQPSPTVESALASRTGTRNTSLQRRSQLSASGTEHVMTTLLTRKGLQFLLIGRVDKE